MVFGVGFFGWVFFGGGGGGWFFLVVFWLFFFGFFSDFFNLKIWIHVLYFFIVITIVLVNSMLRSVVLKKEEMKYLSFLGVTP